MTTGVDRGAAAGAVKAQAPELRLLDRRAFVGFPPIIFAPGVVIADFALQIPDVTFPFSVTGGALRYQRRKLHFGFLEVLIDAEVISRRVAQLAAKLLELEEVKLHFRAGYLEGEARLSTGNRAALTFKVAFDADAEMLAVHIYDVRFYGFAPTPSSQVPVLISQAVANLDLLPEVEPRGAIGFRTRVLPPLVQFAAVSRGYKIPVLEQARLSAVEISGKGVRLRFSAGGISAPAVPDEDLLLTLEGARAFADAEELIANGRLAEAREAYLKRGDLQEAHPFAAERLLSLLVADPQAHDLALDVAVSLGARRKRSAAALWAEAVVREHRGENARAAERYLALCALSRKQGDETSAFFAAEAAARSAQDFAPQLAVKALHELLGVKPDHLPSLQALARAADVAQDRAGAIRAYRRISALARDPAQAADAHVQLGRLCAESEDDVAGARLHCEAALRLSPDMPQALYQLAELCHRSGDHLRAIKALDRLREVAAARHEMDRVGRADLLAGKIWEEGLEQLENARLRFKDAVAVLPGEAEPLHHLGRVAEKLGRMQEALAAYQRAIELAGNAPADAKVRWAAHRSHHALAKLYRTRLGDPARAREHLEAALLLEPNDLAAIDELLPYFRATGRARELAQALERAAGAAEDTAKRAALWAEAGELYRGRLGQPEKAEQLLSSALELDPRHRVALEGMLALAEARRDGGQLCRCLKTLAELAGEPSERISYYRRLSVAAKELAFDFDLAAEALKQLLRLEPDDLSAVGELCAVQRKRADVNGLAAALERRAQIAEARGDHRLAGGALRELGQVLEVRLGRLGEALVALEKAARLAPDASVLTDLADLCLRCERPSHARRALEDVLSLLPRNAAPERIAEIRFRLGQACELLGERDAAVTNYQQAFAVRKLDVELAQRLESHYQEAGAIDSLIDLWATRAESLAAAGRSDEAAPLLLKCARALLAKGRSSAAVQRLSAALDAAPLGPHAGEVLEALAGVEQERGRPTEAAKLIARRASLSSEPRSAARTFFKASSLVRGSAAEHHYLAECIARDSTFAPARVRRAELNAEMDASLALEDLEAALAVNPGDPDATTQSERPEMLRRAAVIAIRAGRTDAARKYLALYLAQRPEDIEARRELINVLRGSGAKEALCEQLEALWPRLSGPERLESCREFAQLVRELGRKLESSEALQILLQADPSDVWAARSLLELLPPASIAAPSQSEERLRLLAVVIPASTGNERAELLAQRAQHYRQGGQIDDARADLLEAAGCSDEPSSIIRQLVEWARETGDAFAELTAWKLGARQPALEETAAPRLLDLAHSFAERREWTAAREAFELCLGTTILDASDRCDAFIGLATACAELGDTLGAAAALWDASRQGPIERRIEALLRRAAMLEAERDLSAAGQSYESALVLAPANAEAREGLKRILRALEDWAGLAELLAAEASHAPRVGSAVLLEELGTIYLDRLGQKGPAEAAFQRAAQIDPENASVRRRLVGLLAEKGELAEASVLVEGLGSTVPPEERAALLRPMIALARERGDVDLALRLARKAHALEPARGDALREFAELLYLKGSVTEALPLQRELADQIDFADAPDLAEEVLLRLADLAEQTEDLELAQSTLRRLLDHRPLCAAAAERLAALLDAEDPRQSIEVLWAYARQLGPSERAAGILVSLASRAKSELSDVELASQLLRRALETSPEPIAIHQGLANLYRDAGRFPELRLELLSIASLSQRAGAANAAIDAFDEAAELALQMGRVDDSLAALQAAREASKIQGNRQLAAAFERRRSLTLRDNKLDLNAAEEALRSSFELFSQLSTAQIGRALAQRRSDPRSEAQWLERAIELHATGSERAEAFFALAELYAGPLSSRPQSEAAVREALALDPSHDKAAALLARILREEGRLEELAEHYRQAAARANEEGDRIALWRSAAEVQLALGRTDDAALSLLAARVAAAQDLKLTAEAAELLHQVGRTGQAAELDASLLQADPMQPVIFERHARFLRRSGDHRALAELLSVRAERESAGSAAASYAQAAEAYRAAGLEGKAEECEERAFASAPEDEKAFEAMMRRVRPDARRTGDLLLARARAVPTQSAQLLWQRAQLLSDAGEWFLAAEALDELLANAPGHWEGLSARAELAARAGGPSAAQPFDRRLLEVGAQHLSAAARARIALRLGHASLASGALQDAADSFEQAVSLDGEGESGRDALSLLREIYERTSNAPGLYRTMMAIAENARPDEAEGLYRRAAELFDDPKHAIEALLRLVQLRPLDAELAHRAIAGLRTLHRYGELVDLCQRAGDSIGGVTGAKMLLEAAKVAQEELRNGPRAAALRDRAYFLDPVIALEDRFEPLMAAGQFETALALADRAADAERAREALWALAEAEGWNARTERLAAELRQLGSFARLVDLAAILQRAGAAAKAVTVLEELAFGKMDSTTRSAALDRLCQMGEGPRVLGLAMHDITEHSPAGWIDTLLDRARETGGPTLAQILHRTAAAVPSRSSVLFRELFELERSEGRFEAAANTLERLLVGEEDFPVRSSLHLELGELYLVNLARPDEARAAFELALSEDLQCVPAVQRLLELYTPEQEADRYVAMVERLSRLLGATAVEPYREPLARAYEALGRNLDALHLLSLFEETPERLRHRADLAHRLGLEGESLQLRERIAESREEQEGILLGYLQADLLPAAVSLAHRMLERAVVSAPTKRALAERLSGASDGAQLAVLLWPELLREKAADPESWKAFAQSLRLVQRVEAAELAQGFFIGLSGAPAACPFPRIEPLTRSPVQVEIDRPRELLQITGESMPRLHRVLSDALSALESGVGRIYLDPSGGAEAYLLSDDELVLGGGALGCFGPGELSYLCALALALGERGQSLTRAGPVEGMEEAAAQAFEAVPSSLAAARVLTVLDEQVRGSDPSRMKALEVLSRSSAFRAIAMKALALM